MLPLRVVDVWCADGDEPNSIRRGVPGVRALTFELAVLSPPSSSIAALVAALSGLVSDGSAIRT
jgi:hypothetical protein